MLLAAAMGLMCWEAQTAPERWPALATACPAAIFPRLTLGFSREVQDDNDYENDIEIVGKIGARALPYLMRLAESDSPKLVRLGHTGLCVVDRDGLLTPADRAGVVDWLVPQLSSPHAGTRLRACFTVSRYPAEAAPAVPYFRAMLLGNDLRAVEAALCAVADLGPLCGCYRPEVLLALSRAALGEGPNPRCALDALTGAWPGHPGNNEALFAALTWRGPDPEFTSTVVPYLDAASLAPGELDWLEDCLAVEPSGLWWRVAEKLIEAGRTAAAVGACLAVAARRPGDELPRAPGASDRLGDRLNAIDVLAKAGRHAGPALPALREILLESSVRLHTDAADAIRRIELAGGRAPDDL